MRKDIKNVLVTGSSGYIGSILVGLLKKTGYCVTGLDAGYFDDPTCKFKKVAAPDRLLKKDLRFVAPKDLVGIDAVCHLAALSNDPMGEINPELTLDINLHASEKLAHLAKTAGVKRFLFASSCSLYGKIGDAPISEETPPQPLTAYAISKVEFEKSLLKLADQNFCAVILRNATAYGSSPKLRLDLVLNNLAAGAFTDKKIKILSDGTPWRPMIHAEDIARLFVTFLEAPTERVCGQIVNCGRNEENFRIKEIAKVVQSAFPEVTIEYAAKPDKDSRSYLVSFDKLAKLIPNFRFKWTLAKAAEELRRDFKKIGLPTRPLEQRNYIRLKQLKHLLEQGLLDEKLFWRD